MKKEGLRIFSQRLVDTKTLSDFDIIETYDQIIEQGVNQNLYPLEFSSRYPSPAESKSHSYHLEIPDQDLPFWVIKANEYKYKGYIGAFGILLTEEKQISAHDSLAGVFFRRFMEDPETLYFHKVYFPKEDFIMPYLSQGFTKRKAPWLNANPKYLKLKKPDGCMINIMKDINPFV